MRQLKTSGERALELQELVSMPTRLRVRLQPSDSSVARSIQDRASKHWLVDPEGESQLPARSCVLRCPKQETAQFRLASPSKVAMGGELTETRATPEPQSELLIHTQNIMSQAAKVPREPGSVG